MEGIAMTRYILSTLLAFSITCIVMGAEPEEDYARIARISYMEGHVSFQGTADVDWSAAVTNFPLQPGDRLYTGPEGKAEIEFDEGSVLRLAERTDIQLLSLRENLIQIRILTGLSSLVVSSDLEFEVDTPAAAFIVLRAGSYRFDTETDGDTYAIVRKGMLEAVSHRFVRRVHSSERIFVSASENSSYELGNYYQRDAWDEWNDRRDADRIADRAREYLPENVYVGVSDLDRHGRWVNVDSYGVAWIPYSVGVSWSPYSVGRWCYRPTWGWTWVSYEPWGWLPYHYGRWHHSVRYGWCWLPGPSFSFNFWSPGLVTFYYGSSWLSWSPLGPGDYYSINNYYYNTRLYRHHVVALQKLHYRHPGDSVNRYARGSFITMDIEHFRNGRSRGIATSSGYRKVDQPWKEGTLARERLTVQPTAKSFSPDPDRIAVRSEIRNPKPAVVYSKPSARLKKQDAYVSLRNTEVSSRAERKEGVFQVPSSADTGRTLDAGPSRLAEDSRGSGSVALRNPTSRSGNSGQPEQQSTRSGNAGTTLSNSRNAGNPATIRTEDARDTRTPSNIFTGDSAVRSRPAITSRQTIGSSVTDRPSAPRPPTSSNSGRGISVRSGTERNNNAPAATGNTSRSAPSSDRLRSTQRDSISTERARTQSSASRSGVSQGTQRSSSSGSVAPSSSTIRSRSSSSSSSVQPSNSGSSSISNRSSSRSVAPSSSSIRSRSTTSSSSARRSSSGSPSISSQSSSRSSSPSSSSSIRSRSTTSSSSAQRSSSGSSSISSRSSSRSSSSSSSSQGSSSSSNSSSGVRKARSRN